ncbi:hypothetical protein LXA43DRAFT_1178930 [Ganoderma leucocontextum]|nr:hypothetical protein LXA43DRAFT_1178930 [Ganoderma leucocontextum]
MLVLSKVVLSSSCVSLARVRLLHASSVAAIANPPGRDPRLSQGNVCNPNHEHRDDPQDQTARNGQRIAKGYSGNPEGVGFVEQVGGATSLGRKGEARPSAGEGKGPQEESTPPGFLANWKSKLGLGTSVEEVKQNRGGGVGVTGTGALPFGKKPHEGRRPYHSSAVLFADQTTKGQVPESSRQPKERTDADQNTHLHHKVGEGPDKGRGNAGEKPTLPSHEVSKDKPSGVSQQKRSFSASLLRFNAKDGAHTADSYFKDVDRAPPPSEKTYQVDGTNPTVQRPNEATSGEYSPAGAQTKEYATVENGTYDVPPSTGPEKDQKLRYGNTQQYYDPHGTGGNTSKPEEGPEGASAGGPKPQGR